MTALFALFAGLLPWTPSYDAETTTEVATYSGTYVVASGKAAVQADIDAAVAHALEQFGAMAKPIAKGRLESAATFCDQYVLEITADHYTNQCDSLPVMDRDIGTDKVVWHKGPDEPIQTQVIRKGDVVQVKLYGDSGLRTNTFKFTGPDTMTLHVGITSDSLDKPMTWTVRYKKQ